MALTKRATREEPLSLELLAEKVRPAMHVAGEIALRYQNNLDIELKTDESPVTKAVIPSCKRTTRARTLQRILLTKKISLKKRDSQ